MAERGRLNSNMPSTYSVVATESEFIRKVQVRMSCGIFRIKRSVMALSQYLSTYWASKGVRVNQITPHGVWNNHEAN